MGRKIILETERLVLREMIQKDFQDLARILRDPNHASIRVSESIGMRKEDEFIAQYYNEDMLHYLYSVHR